MKIIVAVNLTDELEEKLNNLIMKVAVKQNRYPYGIKAKILRKALEEWLEKHKKDAEQIVLN